MAEIPLELFVDAGIRHSFTGTGGIIAGLCWRIFQQQRIAKRSHENSRLNRFILEKTMNIQNYPSPHFTKGRKKGIWPLQRTVPVEAIVIHWFGGGSLDGVVRTFQDRKLAKPRSAHFAVEDSRIVKFVNEEDTAWHAGDFEWNLKTVGIETSAGPGRDASDGTYRSLGELVRMLYAKYGWSPSERRLKPHGSIVATQCPGTVDFDRIYREAFPVNVVVHTPETPAGTPTATGSFTVRHDVRANWRTGATRGSAVFATYGAGTKVACDAVVEGEAVSANGRTSNRWYRSARSGKFISATVATRI